MTGFPLSKFAVSLPIKLTKESTDREKRPKLELTLKSEEDEDLNEVISDLNAMEAFNTVNSVTELCQL